MPPSPRFSPSTAHLSLGGEFFDPVRPADFPMLRLRWRDQTSAARIGLGELTAREWADYFGRFQPLPGAQPEPLALRYHGHQFRTYNPDLGDGRGFLFAQCRDPADGRLLDFGTKGSGQTPWSRAGDGRLTLKGGVREILATHYLAAQGVTTSASFSLFETGEALVRGDEPSPTRSAVLVRLSHGHIRIGSFQRLAYLENLPALESLTRYSLATYFPGVAAGEDMAQQALALLAEAVRGCARLAAQWMAAGFVHGVLNSDNINITAESFDYGPWRWLPTYDPGFTAAYFDQTGLYAFGRQPATLLWNLTRLAECFLPFCAEADLTAALDAYQPQFQAQLRSALFRRLGLATDGEMSDDLRFIGQLFTAMQASRCGFEQTLFDWYGGPLSEARADASPQAAVYRTAEFAEARAGLLARAPAAGITPDHPYFQRPRPVTQLIDRVEALWQPIAEKDDWQPLYEHLDSVAEMAEAYGTGPLTRWSDVPDTEGSQPT